MSFNNLDQNYIKKLFNHESLTTPEIINKDIKNFCKNISNCKPFYIKVEPELWSRQACCILNVTEYIRLYGGNVICGYKIWYNEPDYIEAERHAIWSDGILYKDLTFNADGEDKILFLLDIPSRQADFDSSKIKIRWGKSATAREAIKVAENDEACYRRMGDKESWDKMITYEEYLSGKRMENIIMNNG